MHSSEIYAEYHKKLSELGFTPSSSPSKLIVKDSTVLAESAVGVAVAVVILSYLGISMKLDFTRHFHNQTSIINCQNLVGSSGY